ncbi:MAG TPA: hypothetical protein VN643_01510 [Pyrinomonadaceae bacterium]|nr:hypothetical protein [Pyrinomonadaceae bacterium]
MKIARIEGREKQLEHEPPALHTLAAQQFVRIAVEALRLAGILSLTLHGMGEGRR